MADWDKTAREVCEKELDVFACHACGKLEHIDDLDGKDDGTGEFTRLECAACYGPGYAKAR